MNCQQRRFIKRQKTAHQSYADVLTQQRKVHEAVEVGTARTLKKRYPAQGEVSSQEP
mgnify:FL=1